MFLIHNVKFRVELSPSNIFSSPEQLPNYFGGKFRRVKGFAKEIVLKPAENDFN